MFYSDKQRRFYFAVIAPMEELEGGVLTSIILDPLANALGWEKVEKEETIKSIKAAIKDTKHVALLTPDEAGRIKDIDSDPELQKKMVSIFIDAINNSSLKDAVSESAKIFVNPKKIKAIAQPNFSSNWGPRKNDTEFHAGVDLGTLGAQDVKAPSPVDGVVVYVGEGYGGYGKVVEIMGKDNKIRRFAHLAQQDVKCGDEINAWTNVGTIGMTGEGQTAIHLHYEKRVNYLYYKNGKELTEITYDDLCKLGPKAIEKLTKRENKKSIETKRIFVDDAKRLDDKHEIDPKKHNHSEDPKAEAIQILDELHKQTRIKAVANEVIKKFCKQEKAKAKAAPKQKTELTGKKSGKKKSGAAPKEISIKKAGKTKATK